MNMLLEEDLNLRPSVMKLKMENIEIYILVYEVVLRQNLAFIGKKIIMHTMMQVTLSLLQKM